MIRRLKRIPSKYQALYERAMKGRSQHAAIGVFCLECCGWEIKEVLLCTDSGCPLYPYRPTSRILQEVSKSQPEGQKSKKSDQMVFSYV